MRFWRELGVDFPVRGDLQGDWSGMRCDNAIFGDGRA